MRIAASPTKQQLRRWVDGHRAAEIIDRQIARREGAQTRQAIGLALSIIEAARIAGVPADPLREREIGRVRKTWRRLRRHSGQPWPESAGPHS